MITVTIDLHGKGRVRHLARLEISNQGGTAAEADYSVKAVVVNPNGELRVIQKPLYSFQRKRWNVLGLLLQSLEALGTTSMESEGQHAIE